MQKTTLRFLVVVMVLVAAIGVVGALLYVDSMRAKAEYSAVDEVIQESEFNLRTKELVVGMTESEVIDVMGDPVERWEPEKKGHFDVALFYTMKTSTDAIMVGFVDGKFKTLGPMHGYSKSKKSQKK